MCHVMSRKILFYFNHYIGRFTYLFICSNRSRIQSIFRCFLLFLNSAQFFFVSRFWIVHLACCVHCRLADVSHVCFAQLCLSRVCLCHVAVVYFVFMHIFLLFIPKKKTTNFKVSFIFIEKIDWNLISWILQQSHQIRNTK